ncbi:uncharacterized protein EI90DRAFT_2405375 [Cantharellus anzutake]|uniref:uncharacterized protein n=1 Tax=Cantharellus anzutake TaxID=1750568 RepID=UPI001908F5FA|nr:uncharacterized protein EI90DRAFT_2405375 [Cantharellus anzutake]KAF8338734.1 hypothetical protein EI90DRAFT_2405375 [Cantharellus anzutake]
MSPNVEPPNFHHYHPYGPYPHWAHHYYRGSWFRHGCHRLFWFALGAGAVTWYFSRKELGHGCCGPREEHHRWRRLREREEHTKGLPAGNDESRSSQGNWHEEIERVKRLSHQASNKVAEVTDASLDSVLSAVAALKLKLREAEEKARIMQDQARANPPPSNNIHVDQTPTSSNIPTRHDTSSWPS